MAYKALYRTYRPQKFEDVYGQDIIVQTLKNSIKNNKISHAYLFSGPRGIGKTSIARIFAKALNCPNVIEGEPCCECESCQEILNGSHPDVIEIDAASNNGVDEIREIRDKVKFLPVGTKYKIYIIDEVHMLTQGAFNALLKTLEEPPKHAIFILATTEMHKIPATIISRCQCYEFKSLTIDQVSENLKNIASNESIEITDEAIKGISEACEGGMRDALSILDQAISFSNGQITIDDVNEITGNLNEEKMLDIAIALENKNVSGAIAAINELLNNGKEASKIINSLLELYRDVLLYRNLGTQNEVKKIYEKENFKVLVDQLSDDSIFYYVDILSDIQSKIKYSLTPNIYLEISMIRIVNVGSDAIKLSKKIAELDEKINNGVNNYSSEQTKMSSSVVDNEQVAILETKINRVINQLNQLNIPELIEKVKQLEISQNSKETKDYSLDISAIQEDLLILKTNTNALVNTVDNTEEVDLSPIETKLTELDKKIFDLDQKIEVSSSNTNKEALHLLDQKIQEFDELKEKLYDSKYSNKNDYDIVELKDKIINIEHRLYKYIAIINANETLPIKRQKLKPNEGLAVYEDGIFSIKSSKETSEENKRVIDINPKEVESIENTYQPVKIEEEIKTVEVQMPENDNVVENIEKEEVNPISENENVADEKGELNEQQSVEDEPAIEQKVEEKMTTNNQTNYDMDPFERLKMLQSTTSNQPSNETKKIVKEPIDEVNLFNQLSSNLEKAETAPAKEPKSDMIVGIGVLGQTVEKPMQKSETQNNKVNDNLFAEEKEQFNEKVNDIKVVNTAVQTKYELDEFSAYSIKVVERILNEARSPEARNDRGRVLKIWNVMTRDLDPSQLSVAEILQEGTVAAVGIKELILVYPNAVMCNQVMRLRFKKDSLKLLYDILGDTYNYIALPENIWLDKKNEYSAQYYTGTKDIKLTPFNDVNLSVLKENQEYMDECEKQISQVQEMFGDDIVKVN